MNMLTHTAIKSEDEKNEGVFMVQEIMLLFFQVSFLTTSTWNDYLASNLASGNK